MPSVNQIVPSSPRVQALLSEIEGGNIKIPVFQREFVWDDEQILSLLDSIYQGYPVGSVLLWSTKTTLKSERNLGGFRLPEVPTDYPVKYVLDGQQRLTTLYAVFHSSDPTDLPELAARFDISFALPKEEFQQTVDADAGASVNLRSILDTTKLLEELPRFTPQDQKLIGVLQERFKDYEFPVVTIKDRSNQEVCRVFQRINSSGTSLSTLDLLSAWTWSDKFDLREEIAAIKDRIGTRNFEDLDDAQIMRGLSAIVNGDISTESLVDSKPDSLAAAMTSLKQAILAAIDFLAAEFKIRNIIFVPFPIMIVPLVYFFALKPHPDADQRRQLRKWFWHCSFTQRYKAGTNKRVREDITLMGLLANGQLAFDKVAGPVLDSFFEKSWRINSTAAKATICLLAQMDPMSLVSGVPVDLDSTLAAYNAREFHHIYPKAFLNTLGISFHQANILANMCMLTSRDNKIINDQDPKVYLPEIDDIHRDDALERAFIDVAHRDGRATYAEFTKKRASLLAAKALQLIQQ